MKLSFVTCVRATFFVIFKQEGNPLWDKKGYNGPKKLHNRYNGPKKVTTGYNGNEKSYNDRVTTTSL